MAMYECMYACNFCIVISYRVKLAYVNYLSAFPGSILIGWRLMSSLGFNAHPVTPPPSLCTVCSPGAGDLPRKEVGSCQRGRPLPWMISGMLWARQREDFQFHAEGKTNVVVFTLSTSSFWFFSIMEEILSSFGAETVGCPAKHFTFVSDRTDSKRNTKQAVSVMFRFVSWNYEIFVSDLEPN